MKALRTPICERLGIRHAVFQAGMGWVARADLAAAVSAAGGLGVIGAGSTMTAAELREEIRQVRARTDKPFGVDILFATLRAEGSAVSRYTDAVESMLEVVLEEAVPVLISGLGSPGRVVGEAKRRGIYTMSVVGKTTNGQPRRLGRRDLQENERSRLRHSPGAFGNRAGGGGGAVTHQD